MAENIKSENDIKEKLVAINRITKVVKGGRRFGFAALVVVGNQKGSIGIGQGNKTSTGRNKKSYRSSQKKFNQNSVKRRKNSSSRCRR